MMKFLRSISGIPDLTVKDVVKGLLAVGILFALFYGTTVLAYVFAPVNAL